MEIFNGLSTYCSVIFQTHIHFPRVSFLLLLFEKGFVSNQQWRIHLVGISGK